MDDLMGVCCMPYSLLPLVLMATTIHSIGKHLVKFYVKSILCVVCVWQLTLYLCYNNKIMLHKHWERSVPTFTIHQYCLTFLIKSYLFQWWFCNKVHSINLTFYWNVFFKLLYLTRMFEQLPIVSINAHWYINIV